MTVQDIINEIRIRNDLSHIQDEELMDYINDLDDLLGDTYFPKYASTKVMAEDGENSFDVSEITPAERIAKVYVDGNKALKKSAPDDLLDGWYFSGDIVTLSPDLLGENSEIVFTYKVKRTPHELYDTDFAVPEAFHDLFVFYTLAEIAVKEADTAAYENFKSEYNALLLDAVNAITSPQAYPNAKLR